MTILNKKMLSVGITLILLGFVAAGATYAISAMSNDKSLNAKQDKNSTNGTANQSITLSKVYDNHDSKYSIKYPSEWIYDDTEKGAVVFSGKKETPSYYTTVNIQTVLAKKSGGEYSSVSDLIADVKSQVKKESPKTTFVDSRPFVVTMQNGYKLTGESLSFIYSYQGHIIEQWQIVVPRKDQLIFYTWAYTAPIEQYNDNLPTAKAMLSTWAIY